MRLYYSVLPLLISILLTGCDRAPRNSSVAVVAPSPPAAQVPAPSLDDLGRVIKLERTPRRIVTIGPGATEIIFALGAGARLVGRDSASDYPPPALQVPVVANFAGPFFEKAAAVRPDLIILQGETYDAARAAAWQQKCGAPIAVLAPHTIRGLREGIEKIGSWLDLKDKARVLNARLADAMNQREGTPKAKKRLQAFVEVSRSPLFTAGAGTLIDDVMRAADLDNMARDIKSYKQYNLESLIAKDPDVYIVTESQPHQVRVLKELRAHPILRNLKCVRGGRVIVLPSDLLLRPGPRLGTGIAMLRRAANAVK